MRVPITIAAALGCALTLAAVATAAADPPVDPRYPAMNGHTACGVFSQPLYDAQQAQIHAADTSGSYHHLYELTANDPTEDSFSVQNEYNQWQQVYGWYEQSKVVTANTYAAQNAALCK